MDKNGVPSSGLRRRQRFAATLGALALMIGAGVTFAPSAAASGCTNSPPCGRVVNRSNVTIQVQITPSDIRNLSRGAIGGWSERIDVDFYRIPPRCSARVTATHIPFVSEHPKGPITVSGSRDAWSSWKKLSSDQTVTIESVSCSSQVSTPH